MYTPMPTIQIVLSQVISGQLLSITTALKVTVEILT